MGSKSSAALTTAASHTGGDDSFDVSLLAQKDAAGSDTCPRMDFPSKRLKVNLKYVVRSV